MTSVTVAADRAKLWPPLFPPLLPPLLLTLAVLATFAPVCCHEFVRWDDRHNLVDNPRMNPPSPTGAAYFWANPFYDLYIPVTYTTWSAIAGVARTTTPDALGATLNPYIFHAANLLLHLLSALAVYAILRTLVSSDWPACIGAMLFALHPVQVEPVAWISGMKDVLSGLLGLVAIWQYLLFAIPSSDAERRGAITHFALATIAFTLAMLAKPSAVVVPLIAAILDWKLLRRSLKMIITPCAIWLLLAIPVILIAKLAQPALSLDFVPPLWARPIVALDAMAFYLKKLAVPTALGIDYGRSPQWLWQSGEMRFTWTIPAAALLATLLARRRAPYLFAGLAIFAAALLPVLGLIPFDFQAYSTVADHYLYIAMLGPAIAATFLLARARRPVIFAAAAVLATFAVRSFLQTWHWQDSQSLFSHAIEVNPDSLAGNVNLGIVLGEEAQALVAAGQTNEALSLSARAVNLYIRALRASPADFHAHRRLGDMLMLQKHPAEAAEHFRAALRRDPQSKDTHVALGSALATERHYDEAILHFQEAIKLDPDYEIARRNLALAMKLRDGPPTTRPTPK
jgi:tetratricopeptide (TPR) repeat protein